MIFALYIIHASDESSGLFQSHFVIKRFELAIRG